MKILSVVGARPNFMKIAPIANAISEYNSVQGSQGLEHLIVHTGQHYDDLMSSRFFHDLELPAPDVNLDVRSGTHAVQTARIMERFEAILVSERPDVVLLVGDVNSTVACALVTSKIELNGASRMHRPFIAHIEAGLRSFDRSMPEEINRIITDSLSDLLFVTEESGIKNLKAEGVEDEKIHFVGNVMIDTLVRFRQKASGQDTLKDLGLEEFASGRPFGIVTLHRPSNVDHFDTLDSLVWCLSTISDRLPLLFPIHPRTVANLQKAGLERALRNNHNVHLVAPLGYLDFLGVLASSSLVLTDSGGIQEETTFLRIPCITLRENTERPVTVEVGTNHLVGIAPDTIVQTAFAILDGKTKKGEIPPLWDGQAGKRILNILLNTLLRTHAGSTVTNFRAAP